MRAAERLAGPTASSRAAARLRHPARRAWRDAVRRPAPAHRARARDPARRADPAARRGDQSRSTPRAKRWCRRRSRADAHAPPSSSRTGSPPCCARPHPGAGPGPHRRGGHAAPRGGPAGSMRGWQSCSLRRVDCRPSRRPPPGLTAPSASARCAGCAGRRRRSARDRAAGIRRNRPRQGAAARCPCRSGIAPPRSPVRPTTPNWRETARWRSAAYRCARRRASTQATSLGICFSSSTSAVASLSSSARPPGWITAEPASKKTSDWNTKRSPTTRTSGRSPRIIRSRPKNSSGSVTVPARVAPAQGFSRCPRSLRRACGLLVACFSEASSALLRAPPVTAQRGDLLVQQFHLRHARAATLYCASSCPASSPRDRPRRARPASPFVKPLQPVALGLGRGETGRAARPGRPRARFAAFPATACRSAARSWH